MSEGSAPVSVHQRSVTDRHGLIALLLLSASSLYFEVLLTKLFANKLEAHYTFTIISIALLGFGLGGAWAQFISPQRDSSDLARRDLSLWRYALAYALSLPVSVAVFVALPMSPRLSGWQGSLSLPVYFLLFAVPFSLVGAVVGRLLLTSRVKPSTIYAWDLLGAGLGAVLGPLLLSPLGGYGSVALASALAAIGAFSLRWRRREKRTRALVVSSGALLMAWALLFLVPATLRAFFGLDLVSFKHAPLKAEFLSFGRVAQTYWNPIARVDVSPTGTSVIGGFRYGLSRKHWRDPLFGRMILVDGSANTRQYIFDHRPTRNGILGTALWAAPYVLRPSSRRVLVLGPGGGVDILVGKAFGAQQIDAVELNPDIAKLLVGRPEDPQRQLYTRWLHSDRQTSVHVVNEEARHFVHVQRSAPRYDLIVASGVDTLTAIQTAGNALTENYLYTADAVRDYLRILAPSGQLALTHWHLEPPTLPLKMLETYLEVLEGEGVREPGKHVCILSEGFWESTILKKGAPYTREEIERVREFAAKGGYQVVYDPFQAADAPIKRPGDRILRRLARTPWAQRRAFLDQLPYDLTPATDDRPYFYWIRPNHGGIVASDDGGWIFPQRSVRWMFVFALIVSLLLMFVPAIVLRSKGMPVRPALGAIPFFVAVGLGFVVAENSLFQMLNLFVGGPLISLSLLLPALLAGYGFGSLWVGRKSGSRYAKPGWIALAVAAGFAVSGVAASWWMPQALGWPDLARWTFALVVVLPFGTVVGLVVPWFMDRLRTDSRTEGALAWLWAVSAAANVMGSLGFVPLGEQLGVRGTFVLAFSCYMLALGYAWGWARWQVGRQESAG